jgi:TRAP transporter 4TM/12TM fusion protein
MGIKEILDALQDGAKQSLAVMVACAVVGIVIGVVTLTSFGNVMTSLIVSMGAGSLFLTLILTMFASMVLGMGLPSIPAYIITATMVAPALATFGIPVIVAHLFVFYFGIFANITPPVALASFAGAGIAGGDPMRTGFLSLKLALAGFIVPFMFVYNPDMLMIETRDIAVTAREFALPHWYNIVSVVVTAFVGVMALSASLEGYFKTYMPAWQRLPMAIGGLMLILPETITDVTGIAIVAFFCLLNILQAKREKITATA